MARLLRLRRTATLQRSSVAQRSSFAIHIVALLLFGLVVSAAVRPPKLEYAAREAAQRPDASSCSRTTRRQSCTLQVWYHVGSKNERPGRTGLRAPVRAHDVQGLEERRARSSTRRSISSVGGQSNAYTTEDATVFWETVPAQYLPLVLWLEADRMASLRIDEDDVQERARGREGRAADARREPAVRPAATRSSTTRRSRCIPTSTRRSAAWRTSRRRRSTTCATSTAPTTCPTTRRWRSSATSTRRRRSRSSTQYLGRVPKSERAGAARHPEGAAADARSGASRSRRTGRCRPSSSRTTSPTTAIPIRTRCTSRRRCCRTARARGSTAKLVYEQAAARWRRSAAANIIEDPNLFYAVAIVQPGHTPEEAEKALDRGARPAAERADHATHELQRAKNQFARDYILGRESNQQKATQLAHAVVIHKGDINDGRRRVRHLHEHHGGRRAARGARPTSRRENRLVLTILPQRRAGGAVSTPMPQRGSPLRRSSSPWPLVVLVPRAAPAAQPHAELAVRARRRGRCRRAR